jgi:hypothetical protein
MLNALIADLHDSNDPSGWGGDTATVESANYLYIY